MDDQALDGVYNQPLEGVCTDSLKTAVDRMLSGENPSKEDANRIISAFRVAYSNGEEIKAVGNDDAWKFVCSLTIGNRKVGRVEDLFGLTPLILSWAS
jgi:hypothetical protein